MIQTNSLKVIKAIQFSSSTSSILALIARINHILANTSHWGIQYLSS